MRWLPLSLLLTSACTPRAVTAPENPQPQASARPTTERPGAALYERYCELCHGKEGVGSAAENANALSNVDFLASVSDAFLRLAIHRGRPGTSMAAYSDAYGGPLSAAQVDELIAYMRSFAEGAPVDLAKEVKGDASAGAPLYQQECASCHGDVGQGATAPSISNPLFLASASDGFIRYAIERGRRGTAMPAFGATLSPRQLDDLTRAIRAMVRNVDTTPPTGEVPPTFDTVVINASGPTPELEPLIDGRYVPAARVAAALAKGARMVLLDTRPTSDWLKSHIPGALPLPYYDNQGMMDSLPRDGTWILTYCGCPHAASGKVMDALRAAGFRNTAVIDEGIYHWMERGYPLTFGDAP